MPDTEGRDDLEWALAHIATHGPRYRLFRDYYDGRHRLAFATDKFRNAFGSLFQAFADNLCPAVVDAPADRLQITGWTAAPSAGDAAEAGTGGDLGDRATLEWTRARMPSRAGTAILDAFRAGDAFLIPGRTAGGRWSLYPQVAETMAVEYDAEDPDRRTRAGKVWRCSDRRWRANIYRPEGITRWVTRDRTDERPGHSRFMPLLDDAGPAVASPIAGEVAVLHLPNNPATGQLGRSELVDVIPLQDALNKTVCDMLVASEFVALPQRAFIGVEDDIDPLTGRNRPLELGASRVIRIKSKEAQVVQFNPADLSGFLAIADAFRLEVARVSGTPPQYLQLGSFSQLAAAALRILETRFTRKVGDRAVDWQPELARSAAWLLHLNANAPLGVADRLEPSWAPVEAPAELEDLQVAEGIVRLGGSQREALRRMRYTNAEVDAMVEERRTETTAAAGNALAAFDRDEPVVGTV